MRKKILLIAISLLFLTLFGSLLFLKTAKHTSAQGGACVADLDMVFAIDSTGSMGGVIAQAKAQATNLMTEIRNMLVGSDVRFGVIDFRDYADGAPWPYIIRQTVTDDTAAVQAAINLLAAGGGGDAPEAYARVMHESYNSSAAIGFRPVAFKVLVMMGDNRSHDMAGAPGDAAYLAPNFYDPVANISTSAIATNMAANNTVLINLHSGPYNAAWASIAQLTGGDSYAIAANPTDLARVIVNALLIALFDKDGDGYIDAGCPCDPASPPPGKLCDDRDDRPAPDRGICENPGRMEGTVCGICPPLDDAAGICSVKEHPETATCDINCDDGLDNDQNDDVDLSDPKCLVSGGLVPCGRNRDDPDTVIRESDRCSLCHFGVLGKRLIDFLVEVIAFPLLVLMLLIGGFLLLTSAGSEARVRQGRSIITTAVIAIVLLLAFWVIVNTALFFLTGREAGGIATILGQPWNVIECPICGDGLCEAGETFASCPEDCMTFLWVPLSATNRVVQIDTTTGEIVEIYDVGIDPSRVTVMRGGAVWVGNRGAGTGSVTKLIPDPDNVPKYEVVGTYPLGGAGGTRAVTYDSAGDLWVGNYTDGTVMKLDPATAGILLQTNIVASGPYGAIGDPYGNVWFSLGAADRIVRVDTQNCTPMACPLPPPTSGFTGGYTYGIGMDNTGDIWVGDWGGNQVHEIDGEDAGGIIGNVVNSCTPPGGGCCTGVAVDGDNNVWTSAHDANMVHVIVGGNCATIFSQPNVCTRGFPHGVAIDFQNRAWVVCRTGEVIEYEFTGGGINELRRIDLSGPPVNAGVTANASYNYSDMTGFRTMRCPLQK